MKDKIIGFVALLFGLVWFCIIFSGMAEIREISSTPETIVFQTGDSSVLVAIIMTLYASVFAVVGIFFLVSVSSDFIKRNNKLGFCFVLLFGLFMLGIGIYGIYAFAYSDPCSEYIVINKTAEYIKMEGHYLLRGKTELQIAFEDIEFIKFEYGEFYDPEAGTIRHGRVKLVISNGSEVRYILSNGSEVKYMPREFIGVKVIPNRSEILVSRGAQGYQWMLAKAISDAINKKLVMIEK